MRNTLAILFGISLVAVLAMWFVPPIPQDLQYHRFADTQALFGIPNFWNVASNLPFLAVGVMGLRAAGAAPGALPELKPQYLLFFLGVFLTGLGSGYYHWNPNNDTLVWDRLPMTLAFMAFFSIIIGEHVDIKAGNRLLWPLVLLGIFSVVYWRWTESQGRGDLRLYAIVQFLPMLLIPIILFTLPSRFSSVHYLWLMLAAYALSKVLEYFDHGILKSTGIIGGHPLKHIAAAAGAYYFYLALLHRIPRNPSP